METIYKTYKAIVKSSDAITGEIEMLIPLSTNSIDRDGEVIEPQAFKKVLPKFMKHPVLVASHNYGDLMKQIGEWTKLRITDNGLEGRPKYYVNEGNPEADWAFNLASKGRAAFSVGFIPDMDSIQEGDGKKTPRRTYKNIADLLEISQCIIPSNRDSIQTIRAKSVDPIVKELCDDVEKDLLSDITNAPIVEVTKPEVTENTIRIPVDTGDHTGHKMRTIEISASEGIQALYCVPDKKVLTYVFDKEKWDMDKAKKWVADHSKSFNVEHEVSQNEILDEIDYLKLMLEENGANDKVKESLQGLAEKYLAQGGIVPKESIPLTIIDVIQPTTMAVKEKDIVSPVVETKEPTIEEILNEVKNIKMEER